LDWSFCSNQAVEKRDLWEVGYGAWNGLIWLRIGTSGGHLYTR
jgi:hypothetical protein